jgi:hypothetical protein
VNQLNTVPVFAPLQKLEAPPDFHPAGLRFRAEGGG